MVGREFPSVCVAGGVLVILIALWFVLPLAAKRRSGAGIARRGNERESNMPQKAWIDFLQQHKQAHLVSAVLVPARTASHERRLRDTLKQLIDQLQPGFAFAVTLVRNLGGLLSPSIITSTRTIMSCWSSRRVVRSSTVGPPLAGGLKMSSRRSDKAAPFPWVPKFLAVQSEYRAEPVPCPDRELATL